MHLVLLLATLRLHALAKVCGHLHGFTQILSFSSGAIRSKSRLLLDSRFLLVLEAGSLRTAGLAIHALYAVGVRALMLQLVSFLVIFVLLPLLDRPQKLLSHLFAG